MKYYNQKQNIPTIFQFKSNNIPHITIYLSNPASILHLV
jgi:hypothetical protein